MAWTTPLTAVSNATFTAAQYNASDRDNMLLTPAAIATAAGRIFASTGANAIVERTPTADTNTTANTTTSTSYADLSGSANSAAVTLTVGVNALVSWAVLCTNSNANTNTFASYTVSGATTRAAGDDNAVGGAQATVSATIISGSRVRLETGLTAGATSFIMRYRVSAGTGTFSNRHIGVLPF